MASKGQRAFAWFGASLFIISVLAIPTAIIYQMVQDSKNKDNAQSTSQLSETERKALAAAQAQQNGGKTMDTKLAGTKLADFTPVSSIDKLKVIDIKAGNGEIVKAGDTVTVDYTGAVAVTGTVFQSSLDTGQTVSFGLNQVIAGWSQGIPGMKVGGTRRLLIPASLAYGPNPPAGSGIPSNADLVFDVTLHKVGK